MEVVSARKRAEGGKKQGERLERGTKKKPESIIKGERLTHAHACY